MELLRRRITCFVAGSNKLANQKSQCEIVLLDKFLLPMILLRTSCFERLPVIKEKWAQAPASVEAIVQKKVKALSRDDCLHLGLIRGLIFTHFQALAAMLEMLDLHHTVYNSLMDLNDCGVYVKTQAADSKAKDGFQDVEEYSAEKLQIAIRIGRIVSPRFAKVFLESTVEELVNDILDLQEQKNLDGAEVKRFLDETGLLRP